MNKLVILVVKVHRAVVGRAYFDVWENLELLNLNTGSKKARKRRVKKETDLLQVCR